jgi:hypothetical protein
MVDQKAWRVLRDGEPGDRCVVVAVDLRAPGRAESGFADLAGLLTGPHPVWETVQPDGGQDRVGFWLDRLCADGRPVRAVLGYCVGGVYADRLAERLAAHQPVAPAVLLFDPEPPTIHGLLSEFGFAVDRLATFAGAEHTADLRRRAERAAVAGGGDVARVAAVLVEMFGAAVRPAFARAAIPARIGDQLVDIFSGVMSYFVDAVREEHRASFAGAVTFGSRCPGEWSRLGARTLTFDIDHAGLLGSPAVAYEVDRLLGGVTA